MTEAQLLAEKKKIERAKAELAEIKGEEKQLMKRLQEEFGCSTLEEAKKKIKELVDKQASLEETMETLVEELESYEE